MNANIDIEDSTQIIRAKINETPSMVRRYITSADSLEYLRGPDMNLEVVNVTKPRIENNSAQPAKEMHPNLQDIRIALEIISDTVKKINSKTIDYELMEPGSVGSLNKLAYVCRTLIVNAMDNLVAFEREVLFEP